jgi:adenosylhomocysteine nucleosidase
MNIESQVVIFAAIPEETAVLRGKLARVGARRDVLWGTLAEQRVVLAITGDGARNAGERARALLAEAASAGVQRVLIIGVSGALSHDLSVGDLVVVDEVRDESSLRTLSGDHAWAELVCHEVSAARASSISALGLATSPEDKRRLLRVCSRSAPHCVVDLETHAFATAAAERGLPWIGLRVISDAAHEELPALLARCTDSGGAVRRSRVALSLLTDPRPLRKLWRLRQRVSHASQLLADAAARAVGARVALIQPEARP